MITPDQLKKMPLLEMTTLEFDTDVWMARTICNLQKELKFKSMSETIRHLVRKGIEEESSKCPY